MIEISHVINHTIFYSVYRIAMDEVNKETHADLMYEINKYILHREIPINIISGVIRQIQNDAQEKISNK